MLSLSNDTIWPDDLIIHKNVLENFPFLSKSIISIESSNEEISLMAQQLKDFLLNK